MVTARLAVPALLLLGSLAAPPASAQAPMEIVVNVAAGRLDVFEGGARVRSYPVSVGLPAFATPIRAAEIRRMVWNPTWTPPPVAWARNERPAGPGWGNPMGRVKMHLFEDYYIHGTPASNERRLGRPASHGCIRMRNQDAMELAQMVLRADGAPISQREIQALVRTPTNTREVALRGRVRVRIEYQLTELDAYAVTLHPDVYARSGEGYADRVREELRRLVPDPDAVLVAPGLRSPGVTLRVGRMDINRPPRTAVELVASRADRIVPRPVGRIQLASNAGALR